MIKKYRLRKTSRFNYWAIQFRHSRSIWSLHDPDRKKCIANSRMRSENNFLFRCFHCSSFVLKHEFQIDHIIPIGNSQPQTREEYFECLDKLLVPVEKLQLLCHNCHTSKTAREIKERKK